MRLTTTPRVVEPVETTVPGGRARRDHHPAGGRARRDHSESRRSTYPNRDSRSRGGVVSANGYVHLRVRRTRGDLDRLDHPNSGSITRPPARSPERRLDHPNAGSITRGLRSGAEAVLGSLLG